ncbi:MAG: hypothetical protein WED33_04765, partial [Bacteroidia bacterium]
RIFGTFQEELASVPVKYGLTSNINSFHPLRVVFHEWKAMYADVKREKMLKNKIGYIFGPPGWSPDGSRQTSKELKKLWLDCENMEILPVEIIQSNMTNADFNSVKL